MIVIGVAVVTALVSTANVALVAPAPTVTLASTVAADPLLETETTAPPLGAGPLSVTVPADDVPPLTLAGLSVIEDSVAVVAGVTVRRAVLVAPPYVAVIVSWVELDTELVLTVNVALAVPALTVTLVGTVAADMLLER